MIYTIKRWSLLSLSLSFSVIWYFTLKSARTWLINSVSLDPLNIERTVRGFTSIPIIFYDRYYPSNNLDRSRANDCRLSAPPSLFFSLSLGWSIEITMAEWPNLIFDRTYRPTVWTGVYNFSIRRWKRSAIFLVFRFSLRWIRHFYIRKFCSLIIRISDEKSFKLSFKKNNDSCLPNFPFQDQTTRKPFLPSSSSSSSESQIAAAFEKPRTDNFAARWISNLGRDKCRTAGCSSSPRKRFSSKNKEMEIRVQTRGKSRVFTTGVERNTASI